MAAGVSSLHSFKMSTTIKASYPPVLFPCPLQKFVGCTVSSPTKSNQGNSKICDNFIYTGDLNSLQVISDLAPLCACMTVLWSSPSKGEEANDDGMPHMLELLLVNTWARAGVSHIGKRQRCISGSEPCLLRIQAAAGGHESHRDGDGTSSCGLDVAQLAAAAASSGLRVLICGGCVSPQWTPAPAMWARLMHVVRHSGPQRGQCWPIQKLESTFIFHASSLVQRFFEDSCSTSRWDTMASRGAQPQLRGSALIAVNARQAGHVTTAAPFGGLVDRCSS